MGISMAATAIVARRISEEDVEWAKNNIVQVIYIGILVSICFGVIGIYFATVASEILLTIVSAYYFTLGKWKNSIV